jgi:hypothetical protein
MEGLLGADPPFEILRFPLCLAYAQAKEFLKMVKE